MSNHVFLPLIAGVAGLLTGAAVAWGAPRLAASRLAEPPIYPPATVLVPIVGAFGRGVRLYRVLALELLTGVVLGGLALRYGASRKALIACIFAALLICIAEIDLDYRLVLNKLSLPGTALALALSALWPGIGLLNALEGAAAGLALFFVLQVLGRGALGAGDTKLALLIGAMRGFPGVFNALIPGVLLGGIGALVLLTVFKKGRRDYFAYAPYLVLGALLSLFLPVR